MYNKSNDHKVYMITKVLLIRLIKVLLIRLIKVLLIRLTTSNTEDDQQLTNIMFIAQQSTIVSHFLDQVRHHITYMSSWGNYFYIIISINTQNSY